MPRDERAQDLAFMRIALEAAAKAPAVGEVPIAAVIVQAGRVWPRHIIIENSGRTPRPMRRSLRSAPQRAAWAHGD